MGWSGSGDDYHKGTPFGRGSHRNYKEAFVWIWLPDETAPVVAGKLEVDNLSILFNYGKSYFE